MKLLCFFPSPEGVLLFASCNDTVFRIHNSGIEPAYVYCDGIADINRLGDNTVEDDATIGVYDLFETLHYFYIRLYKGEGIYIQQFYRGNGELRSVRVPDDYMECSEGIPGNNVLGLPNDMDGGVPFWPEYTSSDGTHAQVVGAYAVSLLREKGYLKHAPGELDVSGDKNPVVILYTFRK